MPLPMLETISSLVLDPSNSAGAQSSAVLPQSSTNGSYTPAPGALAVTDSGAVYYSTQGSAPLINFHKLNSATGATTDFPGFPGLPPGQAPVVLLSPDGASVYTDVCANCSVSTSTDKVSNGLPGFGAPNLALSSDGISLINDRFYFYKTSSTLQPTSGLLLPTQNYLSGQPNLPSSIGFLVSYEIYGEKFGASIIAVQPRTDSLDVYEAGEMVSRVQLPLSLVTWNSGAAPSFVAPLDALVTTNEKGAFLVILPSGGIAKVDLSFLAPFIDNN